MTDRHHDEEFLVKLRRARLDAGLTQTDVGTILHCDQSAISKKEKGDRPVYAWEFLEFCKIYKQPPDFFLGKSGG